MATATINASLQGVVERADTSLSTINWLSTTRDATTGTSATTITSNTEFNSMRAQYELSKGTYISRCVRAFLFFDLSSINGTITAATLKVLAGGTGNTDDVQVVPSTAWGGGGDTTTLSTGDYDAVEFLTDAGSSYGQILSWTASSYNDFTLSSDAISDMNNDGYLNCALLNQDNDYRGISPSLGTDIVHTIEYNDATNPIKVEITYTPGASWNENLNGVTNSNIAKVNGVAKASILEVNKIQI